MKYFKEYLKIIQEGYEEQESEEGEDQNEVIKKLKEKIVKSKNINELYKALRFIVVEFESPKVKIDNEQKTKFKKLFTLKFNKIKSSTKQTQTEVNFEKYLKKFPTNLNSGDMEII